MRFLPAFLSVLTLALGLGGAAAKADQVVVELYTSQGCSSCPPADALLAELAGRDDILALSLHVDYWDWIGWKDTFAQPAFSDRQLAYSEAVGSNVRYTPQFIVAGTGRVAGAEPMSLMKAISDHQGDESAVTFDGGTVAIAASRAQGQIVVVDYTPSETVKVLHGENAGHEITYHNIVRDWRVVQDWDGTAQRLTVPPAPEGQRRAVMVQSLVNGRLGEILGAVRLP